MKQCGKCRASRKCPRSAPMSLRECHSYKSNIKQMINGHRLRFKSMPKELTGDENDELILTQLALLPPMKIIFRSPDDIGRRLSKLVGNSRSDFGPKLQPIETRLVMLQTGMRALWVLSAGLPISSYRSLWFRAKRVATNGRCQGCRSIRDRSWANPISYWI